LESCGVQLQPLLDALKRELLRHGVLHADETPVSVQAPRKKKTHHAYLWTYCPGVSNSRAIDYHFAPSHAGKHARAFLQQDN
jgi:transposase